jgi:hypothetical protein
VQKSPEKNKANRINNVCIVDVHPFASRRNIQAQRALDVLIIT